MRNIESIDNLDFYFNGKWLSSFGGVIAGSDGFKHLSVTPTLDIKTEQVLGRDGQVPYESMYEPRVFVVPVLFSDIRKVRDIAGWLNVRTPQDFYFKGDDIKLKCMIDKLVDLDLYCYQGVVELKFIAHYPFYTAINDMKWVITKSDKDGTPIKNGYITNLTLKSLSNIVLFNDGNKESYPLYKIIGSGDISIKVNNKTLTIKSVSEHVYADALYQTAYKGDAVITNYTGKTDGEPPMLSFGDNTISVTGNCTQLEVQTRSEWI